ncbi:MAG: serine/threonine-protein phosphatase [Anaerolineae bacterium]|nr:serine/threonine-protein phosphatase [Anaerolineae bacterium]
MTDSPSSFGIDVAFRSDVGRTRRHNEDYADYYTPDDPQELAARGRLYVVADGVGGAAAGDVASRYAVRKALAYYYAPEGQVEEMDGQDPQARLIQAVQVASADIYEFSVPRAQPMATTLVAALVRGGELLVANVGDSRAYLVRGDQIRQVTDDHSLVAQKVRQGQVAPEHAAAHPQRNLLTRTVGGGASVEVDVFAGPLRMGDIVVLCTDGLTRYLPDEEIAQHVRTLRPQQAVDAMVALANERGGKDNITVLVLQAVEPEDDLDTQPRMPPAAVIESPDLEEELARSIVMQRPFQGAWWRVPRDWWRSPAALAALAMLVIGLAFILLGGAGDSAAPATLAVTGTAPFQGAATQTPNALFLQPAGAAVRFVTDAALHVEPSADAGEVFHAVEGHRAQVLGGPTWDASSAVWWLLKLTPADGQPVTGWAMQSVLDVVP